MGSTITFKIREPSADVDVVAWLESAMKEIHTVLVSGSEPGDVIGIEFRNAAFTRGPVGISYRPVREFHFDNLFEIISSVAQSSAGFCIDESFTIDCNIISMPVGSGRPKKPIRGDITKKSILYITNVDNLCLPRAIVAGRVYAERGQLRQGKLHRQWVLVRGENSSSQTALAEALLEYANVEIPEGGCGVEELKAFQQVLAPDGIAIIVFDREGFGSSEPAFFDGTDTVLRCVPDVQHKVYLLYDREIRHYDVILKLAQAAGFSFFCVPCGFAYSRVTAHKCMQKCPHCKSSPPCNPELEKIRCVDCSRFFRGADCLEKHREIGSHGAQTRLCDMLQTCPDCLRQVYKKDSATHECNRYYCKTCKVVRPENHQCFMAKLQPAKPSKLPDLFIFYDFETRQERKIEGTNDVYLHEPSLCVSQQRCTECIGVSDDVWECSLCGKDGERIFKGNPLAEFVEFLLQERNVRQIVCIAHNAKGFDAQFILQYFVERLGKTPTLISNGTSIMEMKIGKLRFIDSLNYFHMPLSKLPKAFGLGDNIFKGTFPHLFNTTANENYKGPLPPLPTYSPDTMSQADRKVLLDWHEKNTAAGYVFDFQKEIVAYCRTDVAILRKACVAFREIFMQRGKVCPFTEAVTIASACNKVYRRNFLDEDKIAVLPRNGYRRADRQSEIAIEWLLWEEQNFGKPIIHAGRGREYRLRDGTLVDGYVQTDDGVEHVLQFHGCFFHGCDRCYTTVSKRNEEFCGCTLNDRFTRTLAISERIKSLGYSLHEMWECDYKRLKSRNPDINVAIDGHPVLTNKPLNPRDAFFGGRTGNTRSYYEISDSEKIHYIDVCSLYPYISKYGRFPVGHPQVYTEDICRDLVGVNNDLRNVEGLVRCTVLPPRNLYHLVLPVRMHNRLMFALCRKCCEEMHQGSCNHDAEADRAFEGTWVSCELQKAVEKGYTILAVHEIWQYNVEQYSKSTKTAGLFGQYINLWLKIKQEASGWPTECTTRQSQDAYIQSFLEVENVQLERGCIEVNPGLRSVAKLCLNSFWGKFGQRENLPKTEVVTTRRRLLELLSDRSCIVYKIIHVNDDVMYVSWEKIAESIEVNPHVNVVIAAYTTAQARLKLYSYLEQLDKRVLYYDTDSCIYVSTGNAGEYDPPLGNFLGDMTDELTGYGIGSFIKRFVSGGPKFYGYVVQKANGEEVATCKVKGIGLNFKNGEKINFDSICKLVREPGTSITVNFSAIRRDAFHRVTTRQESKTCKPVLVKRRRWGEHDSLPYGYIG